MSNKSKFGSSNRRDFLARSTLIASTALIASDTIASTPPALLRDDDPIAVALGYAADASKVDTVAYPKRAGEAGAKQYCSNCSLYKTSGEGSYGTCAAIPGKLVAGRGWCNAWIPS